MKRKLWIGLIVIILIVMAALLYGSHYLYTYAVVSKNESHMPLKYDGPTSGAAFSPDNSFLRKTPYESLSLTSHDGLALSGYLYKNEKATDRLAILYHGYSSEAMQMTGMAQHYYDMGYHVFLSDARGHGASEGKFIGMGWLERQDNLDWIDLLIETFGQDTQIVLHGISMGGATVMMLSGEALPPQVKCIVEDCGYTSVWDEFDFQMGAMFGLKSFPLLYMAQIESQLFAGYNFKEASSLAQVQKATVPMLFIHGAQDTFVPTWMVYPLYEACTSEKQLLVVENAGHGMAMDTDSDLYWHTVTAFESQYLRN